MDAVLQDLLRRLDAQEGEVRRLRDGGGPRGGGPLRTDAANAKPPVFTAETKKLSFSDWNFKFRAYAGHQSSEMLTAMNNIQHHRDPLDMATYTEEQRQMAMILYFHLTMYTEGTPLGVVRKVQNNDGFEAYRRLSYQ